jgi:hypothetical protein
MTRVDEEGGTAVRPPDAAEPKDRDHVSRVLKWVGGVAAVLLLILALVQVTERVTDRRERGRRLRELQLLAQRQLEAGDFPAAWTSVRAAGEVDARHAEVRRLREDVAMTWLRSVAIQIANGGEGLGARSFAELVDPLVPTLDQGAIEADGGRKADLLAHRGWADYLRGRDDGSPRRDPVPFYLSAIEADSGNPYAHALWGLGLALARRAPGEARDHFAAAVAGGRARAFVRRLQIIGLLADVTPEGDIELLRVSDAIRREDGTVSPGARRQLHARYWSRMPDSAQRAVFLTALPADAHLATYRWLFDEDLRDSTREPSYTLHLAQLQEQAGDTAGAIALMRRLRAAHENWRRDEQALMDAAIARADRAAARPVRGTRPH